MFFCHFIVLLLFLNEINEDGDRKLGLYTTTGFEDTTYAKPEHLAHWTMAPAAVGDIGLKVQYKLAHVRYTPARA